jgi:hypothetical protein
LHHGDAVAAGVLGSLTHQLDISLLYRYFSRDYYSFYSNAVAENTTPQNEVGLYWGWKQVFSKKYSLTGYVDLFRFPWLRYRGYAPSDGSEWLMRFNYQPSKSVLLFVQAREESKIRNLPDDRTLYQTGLGIKRNFWINCDYTTDTGLSFKTRIQCSTYKLEGQSSRGFVLVQDISYDVGRFSIAGRYSLFDVDDYENRLYIYERDVWLAFSFPTYYGVGVRQYAMVQYKVGRRVDLWLRWAHSRFTDRQTLGSEGETIHGNVTNDVKLQVRLKL